MAVGCRPMDSPNKPKDLPEKLATSPIEIGSFALLEVVATERIGAFLYWGQPKDLFLPFSEQTRDVRVGQKVLIYVYLDNNQRPTASMRVDRNITRDVTDLQDGDQVDLQICAQTDIGFKAIINGKFMGVLYGDEVFKPLHYGQQLTGFIKKVRPDQKIDLTLDDPSKSGHRAAEGIDDMILSQLEASPDGFLAINDKTPAEEIYERFAVSKKKYKIALGGLYRQRLITVDEDGIRLVKKP
ncbi:MAG: GntR family transcriptional regulator [Proteobacteria bacterium]|nr:MAG: GntR family transcriptional regulator [Pseudomonadota bacterium]